MLTMASARRSVSFCVSRDGPPPWSANTISLPIRSITSMARVLLSINRPARMPRTSDGTLSRPCDGAREAMLWPIVSLIRARLMMHSRITDSATCW